jgi:hypothetical protein
MMRAVELCASRVSVPVLHEPQKALLLVTAPPVERNGRGLCRSVRLGEKLNQRRCPKIGRQGRAIELTFETR